MFYAPEENNDLNAILGGMGVNDTAEQRVETLQNYLEIFSSVGESYGREIELVRFAGPARPTTWWPRPPTPPTSSPWSRSR